MSEAAQIAPEAAGVIEPLPQRSPKKNPFTFDVDGIVDEALAKSPPGGRSAPTDTARSRAERDVESALGKEFGYGEDPPEPAVEEDDEPAPAPKPKPKPAPEPGDEPEPDDAAVQSDEDGTKARPYKREDLPDDRFIELKVNGEKVVVPVRELADSYSGQKEIARQLAKLGEERTVMTSQVEEARTAAQKIRDSAKELFSDPEQLYDLLSNNEEFEGTLQEISRRRWLDLQKWRDNPTERAAFIHQRGQRQLETQRQQYQEQQQRLQQEQHQRSLAEHQQKVMQPGYDEGLRKAGYPDVSHPEFKPLAQTLLQQLMQQGGRQLASQEDVTTAVFRACQILKLAPGANAPPPKRPVIAQKAQAEQPRRKDGKWDAMSKQRRANDADYFMRDMRLRK